MRCHFPCQWFLLSPQNIESFLEWSILFQLRYLYIISVMIMRVTNTGLYIFHALFNFYNNPYEQNYYKFHLTWGNRFREVTNLLLTCLSVNSQSQRKQLQEGRKGLSSSLPHARGPSAVPGTQQFPNCMFNELVSEYTAMCTLNSRHFQFHKRKSRHVFPTYYLCQGL